MNNRIRKIHLNSHANMHSHTKEVSVSGTKSHFLNSSYVLIVPASNRSWVCFPMMNEHSQNYPFTANIWKERSAWSISGNNWNTFTIVIQDSFSWYLSFLFPPWFFKKKKATYGTFSFTKTNSLCYCLHFVFQVTGLRIFFGFQIKALAVFLISSKTPSIWNQL